MPATGTPKFNALVVAEVQIDFKLSGKQMTATAAYVDQSTGDTHGWTKGSGPWSKETLDKLQELRSLLEQDLANRDFIPGPSNREVRNLNKPEGLGGLGEHLNDGVKQA